MFKLPSFSEEAIKHQANPIIVLSGDSIYLVFANGKVEFIPSNLIEIFKTKIPLEQYLVWGDLAVS